MWPSLQHPDIALCMRQHHLPPPTLTLLLCRASRNNQERTNTIQYSQAGISSVHWQRTCLCEAVHVRYVQHKTVLPQMAKVMYTLYVEPDHVTDCVSLHCRMC